MTPVDTPATQGGSIDRRLFAAAALGSLAAPALVGRARADDLTKVKMILAWLPEGSYAYAFVARAKGFWRSRGLDVEIARGFGSFASAQAVAAGQFDFAMTNPSSVVLLATKSIALKMIGLMDYDSFMAVGLLQDSPIKAPHDLEGKNVGQTLSSSDAVFFKVFADRTKLDLSRVALANVDAKVRNQALASKQQDAITGLVSSMLPSMSVQGTKTRYMLYRDYGVDLYGNIGIACSPETFARRSKVCSAFMAGLTEGLHYTLMHSDDAAEIFLREVPEMRLSATGAAFSRLGMSVQRASVLTERSIVDQGLGWTDVGKVGTAADLVMTYQAEPSAARPDISNLVSNDFVGAVKMTPAEWTQAKGSSDAVLAMMRGG